MPRPSSCSSSYLGGNGGTPALTSSAIVAQAVPGSHVLKIDGYSRTKGLGNGKCIKSETFAVGGHRWYLRYYPDGNSSCDADGICVYLFLDEDDYNGGVKVQYKISLLDQHGNPVPSYSVGTNPKYFYPGEGWGGRIIKRRHLEKSVYLKDDVFSVRCDLSVAKKIFTKTIPALAVRGGIKKEKAGY